MALPVFAAIDIGTNTVLLVVAERGADGRFTPLVERAEITRLGKGVDASGLLQAENITRTADVVGRFATEARKLGAKQIACVATSAARDAKNGSEFFNAIAQHAQLEPEIISGDDEAQFAYLAAERDFGSGAKVVIDIGGGSTEFVFGTNGRVAFRRSFDLGSVRLTERHVKHDPPTNSERDAVQSELDRAFAALPAREPNAEVVGVAGTATNVFTVERGVHPYDASRAHGQLLSRGEVESCAERLWSLRVDDRKKLPGMVAERADVLATGAMILARALAALDAAAVRISDRGVRWGLLYARFGEAA